MGSTMLERRIHDQLSFDHNQFNEMHDAVDLLVEEGAVFLLAGDDNIITNLNGTEDMKVAADAVLAFLLHNEQDRLQFIKGLVRIMRIKHGV